MERKRRVPAYPARGGFPAEPRHGFHGRARELLHLQRTLADKPIVVLHGYGGQGKTTLAAHAARWFTRTHRFERAVFVSFENGGGLEWALSEMGNALIGDDFAIHQGDPIDAIAADTARHAHPRRVGQLRIHPAQRQRPAARRRICKYCLNAALRSGSQSTLSNRKSAIDLHPSSFILHPSSLPPAIPPSPTPTSNPARSTAHTELPGLGRLDALELAGQILKDRGIARPPREKLAELLDFLGCHPLSIQLVVPHLRNNTPEKLIAEFDELLARLHHGRGQGTQ